MLSTEKLLYLSDARSAEAPLPAASEIRARFCEADFQGTPLCPWWVGKAPVVNNAIDWVSGADAAAVYLVRGQLVAAVARRAGRRVVWATAELGALALKRAA